MQTAHWRDAGLRPVIFGIDARIAIFWLVTILHVRTWTIVSTLAITALFAVLRWMGLPLEAAGRGARSWLAGAKLPCRPGL